MNAAAGGPPPPGAAGGRAAAAKSRINFPESDSEDSDDEGGKVKAVQKKESNKKVRHTA